MKNEIIKESMRKRMNGFMVLGRLFPIQDEAIAYGKAHTKVNDFFELGRVKVSVLGLTEWIGGGRIYGRKKRQKK